MILALGLTACSSVRTFSTESRLPEQPLTVDGKIDDWQGKLLLVEDPPLAVGFLNDAENLYVCLLANEPQMRDQIMRSGLTVWFDPNGGRTKALGIKFPLGESPRQGSASGERSEGAVQGGMEARSNELEITRPGERTPQIFGIDQAKGIDIKAVPSASELVYELKIRLLPTDNDSIAVGAGAGKTIGVGFEVGKFVPNVGKGAQGRSGAAGGAGSGMPGMGGGRGRGGIGGMGGIGQGQALPEEWKLWASVRLTQR